MLKAHRIEGDGGKSWWLPMGTSRDKAYPVNTEPPGPVWICPGELKALGVAAVGRASIGITCGETSAKLPDEVIEAIRGRAVALPADADKGGKKWLAGVVPQLDAAGIDDVRIPALGLAPGEDIGDWLTQRLIEDAKEPEAVAATLDDLWERADPWHATP